MRIEQKLWIDQSGWSNVVNHNISSAAQLVLAFGDKEALSVPERFEEIRSFYPNADIVTCSTAGEILDEKVSEGTINVTAIVFEATNVRTHLVSISNSDHSFNAGEKLLDELKSDDLVYTLVISDGHIVNGSELTKALGQNTDSIVTGGLAGDGPNFQSTLVGLNEAPSEGMIVGVGFYGQNLQVGHAARGGWDPFGPERMVTKSKANVLYELDGKSALDLYKKYLGELADELPGSALLFPLSIKSNGSSPLVRTVLSVDEEEKSMTFAGDIPQGSIARMMRSNFERLIDGASRAADISISDFGSFEPDLALLISCAGRKFALGERVEEEVERVKEVLGDNTVIAGFYSYGEISPVVSSTKCELHNQTMTITTLKETV
ncbi:MAG: FIST N-terminal domain-containing protein [Bacteroidota bacterium]